MDVVLSSTDPPRQKVRVEITGHFEDVDEAANAIINCHKEQFDNYELKEVGNNYADEDDEYTAIIIFTKKDPAIGTHLQSILSDHTNIRFSIRVMEGTNDEGAMDA